MISLLLILSIVGLVVFTILCKNAKSEDGQMAFAICAFLCACLVVVFLIFTVHLCYDVGSRQSIIEQKIAMYQEENQAIEEKIDSLVKNYMEYEAGTYEQFKNESSIELVSLFPELKSDNLVMEQMKLYNENKQRITNLKSQLVDMASSRWLLYFGK